MRTGAFQAGLLFAALIMGTFVALEGEQFGKKIGLVEADPVLVFVIPQPESAARIRKVVSADRILWEGDAGFALVGDRVITTSYEEAGAVISGAGWIDRPIQIVTLDADPDDEATAEDEGGGTQASPEARRKRLLELVNKPTLSRGEQMFVLSAMNDGIEL